MIKRFSVILKAISSGLPLNEREFRHYCWETAELYVQLYPWYHMPPTVHKVLIHGADIAKESILPLGQLSEEAIEARNQDIRKFRERFSRKTSRVATNQDLFKKLLLISDPLISSYTSVLPKKSAGLPREVKYLLLKSETEKDLIYSESENSEY